MWDLLRPGIEPVAPALGGGFSTAEPPSCLKEACKEDGSGMPGVGWGAALPSFSCIYQHAAPGVGWAPLGGRPLQS